MLLDHCREEQDGGGFNLRGLIPAHNLQPLMQPPMSMDLHRHWRTYRYDMSTSTEIFAISTEVCLQVLHACKKAILYMCVVLCLCMWWCIVCICIAIFYLLHIPPKLPQEHHHHRRLSIKPETTGEAVSVSHYDRIVYIAAVVFTYHMYKTHIFMQLNQSIMVTEYASYMPYI